MNKMSATTNNRVSIALAGALVLFSAPAPGEQPVPAGDPAVVDCSDRPGELRRRRPGRPRPAPPPCDPGGLPAAAWGDLPELALVPDRWRIVSALGYPERWWDPYSGNNVLKGDRPAFGDDWFFSLKVVSDSSFEFRKLPTPVGGSTTERPGSLDIFGSSDQQVFNQLLIVETVLYKGDTVFRPPDYEFRFVPVFNLNHVSVDERGFLRANPGTGTSRNEGFVGIQGLFVDKHLRNVSQRYDFDSLRIGIQPITADFRGFLFQDSPFGVRLFGTRDNNRWQYNLGWFRRFEKDTNSGLNDFPKQSLADALRDDDVFLFNVYRQDFPWLGFTSQFVLVHNRNRETGESFFDDNGFIVRPASLGTERLREYDVSYVGLNGDGHIGRWNLTLSGYFAFGEETPSVFRDGKTDIRAFFTAAETSIDFDWYRIRATVVYASGDDDPFDDRATGFDAILENPLIAGADTSFWMRQAIPFIGGGKVALSGQNGLLNSLRASKGQGQSNFTNPGLSLIGLGADLDLTPRLRLSVNLNQLWFNETAVLEASRNQSGISRNIGLDASLSLTYRPLISQNIILRLSASGLLPGAGYKSLFGDDKPYAILANLVLDY